jgi:hypothetical protein
MPRARPMVSPNAFCSLLMVACCTAGRTAGVKRSRNSLEWICVGLGYHDAGPVVLRAASQASYARRGKDFWA